MADSGADAAMPPDRALRDVTSGDTAPVPGVSTVAGTGCPGYTGPGRRLEMRIGTPQAILFDIRASSLFYGANLGGWWGIFVVKGDDIELMVGAHPDAGPINLPDGPFATARVAEVHGIAGSAERLYVAEKTRIRILEAGRVTTIAGGLESGYVDGLAEAARFEHIRDITLDADGSLIIADLRHIRVLKDGLVTTIAGQGNCEWTVKTSKDGPALQACLAAPYPLVITPEGLVFGDNGRLRRMSQGTITTIAGATLAYQHVDGPLRDARFSALLAVLRLEGLLYVTDMTRLRTVGAEEVRTIVGTDVKGFRDGPFAVAQFHHPSALSADSSGNLYVADANNCRIRYVRFR